jgi:uncharacterized protein YndB with AHSA1/START domain
MTGTENASATSTELTADYEKTIVFKADPGAAFDALTELSGLSAWWTRATGSGDAGRELQFRFDAPDPCVMRVDQATRSTAVQWTVTACNFLPEWVGTRPVFTITPVDRDTTELHFRHHGLTPNLECIDMCTRGWDHFLESLRQYVEVGRGMPYGSDVDQARRVRQTHEHE